MTGILRSVDDLRDSAGSSSPWGGGWLADMIGQGQTEDHCNSIEQARFASGTLFSMNSKHFWGFFCWMQGRGDREGPDLLRMGSAIRGWSGVRLVGKRLTPPPFFFFGRRSGHPKWARAHRRPGVTEDNRNRTERGSSHICDSKTRPRTLQQRADLATIAVPQCEVLPVSSRSDRLSRGLYWS